MEDVVVQSVVRLPSPPPPQTANSKRKWSPSSTSPSPRRYRSPPRGPARGGPSLPDIDPQRAMERERQLAERMRQRETEKEKEQEKPKLDPKAEYEKLLSMRSGGTYIPPARLRALQAQITDKNSKEYQRMAWEALKKSINGLINKVNVSNIKHIVPELFGENLIRGRGLYCRSIMKAQAASLPFTAIYAAMTAIVNTKLPQVGELLLNRLVVQFRKAFKRNDKAVCLSSTTFIAHLCNQQVANEILAIEILMLLLDKPTDGSVEIAVGLMREVGAHLEQMSPPANNAVYEQFRTILHEASIDKRSQYMVEVLFQVRKDKYKDHPIIREELDLVEEEDQITHRTELDDEIDTADGLNVFKFDPDWEEHEELYRKTKAEILGEGSEGESDEEEDDDSSDEEDEEKQEDKKIEIQDQTNTNLVNLRRTIYLTIMSSIDFEECCHKLMKITLPPGLEKELCLMVIECCSQERTYSKFYGLIGERFAKLNRLWTELFEDCFRTYYDTIHRYETNRLRNIARFFGHQLSSDALGWHVLSVVHINEEETTSSSRIFAKILFQDLAECMGMKKLQERLKDPFLQDAYTGLFPKDNPRNTRFSINYFTSIGMGGVTEDMREHLKNNVEAQAAIAPPPPARDVSDTSSDHMTVDQGAGVEGELLKGKARQEATHDLLVEATAAGVLAGVEAAAIASARVMILTHIEAAATLQPVAALHIPADHRLQNAPSRAERTAIPRHREADGEAPLQVTVEVEAGVQRQFAALLGKGIQGNGIVMTAEGVGKIIIGEVVEETGVIQGTGEIVMLGEEMKDLLRKLVNKVEEGQGELELPTSCE
ncbi:uncharacterized protein H6S33_001742 [Morchella sextelata]|uniref:uncharacterized protein n=1 Tax=Morchella sextelata TaxID=1174677 RepID=UPI001D04BDCC|nr:uncharacterized protein H6S33_001742 [Morchella sextelata]KAH0608608.1 hypothetical protein H6S33_001742 [Morchella sextelata]